MVKTTIYFSDDEKILVVSGTHGDLPKTDFQSGVSGLTDKNELVHDFYVEDCMLIGIEPGPRRVFRNLPIDWEGEKESKETFRKQADITRKPERMDNPIDDSFAKDELFCKMDVRVVNMAYYFGHTQKLLDDIAKVHNQIKSLYCIILQLSSV